MDSASPRAKRLCSNQDLNTSNLDDSVSRMCQSQPVPAVLFCSDLKSDCNMMEARNDYCFSQPTMMDDLLLCTQLNATQGSGASNPFQRLVRRMTRFFVTTKCDETIMRLTKFLEKMGFTYKLHDGSTVTISTVDRRKLQLTFKANLLEMDGKILLDFRLSKGCGLEFKRKFIKIKTGLSDIVQKGPILWPIISLATNH